MGEEEGTVLKMSLGQVYGTVVKMLCGTPSSCIQVPGSSLASTPNSGFLPHLEEAAGGAHGRPGWRSKLLV